MLDQRSTGPERALPLGLRSWLNVRAIHPEHVELEHLGEAKKLENNQVIICAGGILPTPFLEKSGVEVETKFGAL